MNLNKTIKEALEEKMYFYEVSDGHYTISGDRYRYDYTPADDTDAYTEGWESDYFDTWDELVEALDEDLILCKKVEEFDINEFESNINEPGQKEIMSYETSKYETHEDDYGHYWEGEVYYVVTIYAKYFEGE